MVLTNLDKQASSSKISNARLSFKTQSKLLIAAGLINNLRSMYNYIRQVVSGAKRRYKDECYNLDLTYISPRIIAMSMPGEGIIETAYRNELSEVSKFLNEHHGDLYAVINLSQKEYSYSKFNNKVDML